MLVSATMRCSETRLARAVTLRAWSMYTHTHTNAHPHSRAPASARWAALVPVALGTPGMAPAPYADGRMHTGPVQDAGLSDVRHARHRTAPQGTLNPTLTLTPTRAPVAMQDAGLSDVANFIHAA